MPDGAVKGAQGDGGAALTSTQPFIGLIAFPQESARVYSLDFSPKCMYPVSRGWKLIVTLVKMNPPRGEKKKSPVQAGKVAEGF